VKLRISIDMDNAAFVDGYGDAEHGACHAEVVRILRDFADHKIIALQGDTQSWPLRDINGNRVGTAKVVP